MNTVPASRLSTPAALRQRCLSRLMVCGCLALWAGGIVGAQPFTEGFERPKDLVYWRMDGQPAVADDSYALVGKHSMRMTPRADRARELTRDLAGGKARQVTVTAIVRGSGLSLDPRHSDRAVLAVRWRTAEGQDGGVAALIDPEQVNSKVQAVSCEAKVPAQVAALQVVVRLPQNARGELWVDGIQLQDGTDLWAVGFFMGMLLASAVGSRGCWGAVGCVSPMVAFGALILALSARDFPDAIAIVVTFIIGFVIAGGVSAASKAAA